MNSIYIAFLTDHERYYIIVYKYFHARARTHTHVNFYILLYSIVGDRLEMQLYLLGCVPTNQLQGCLKDASLCEMLSVPSNQRLSQLPNDIYKMGVRALPPFCKCHVENGLGTAAQSHDNPVEKAFRDCVRPAASCFVVVGCVPSAIGICFPTTFFTH